MLQENHQLIFNIKMDEYVGLALYQQRNGYRALAKVLSGSEEESLAELKDAELRGRGGAAFPTGQKIQNVRQDKERERYIICNADEGEPGTFKDRFVMTHLPFQLLEGITIAAYLAGASKGYIYVRHEYPEVQKKLRESIRQAMDAGFLGKNIMGSGYDLELKIFSGAGSYLCGEETALLSSIEGKKGRPRLKPPYPTEQGLWGKPTLIQNVETLSNIPVIIHKGSRWYQRIGTESSRGTKLISLSGDVRRKGVFEVPFGTTFKEIIEIYGGGTLPGRFIKAVNIGGASGVLVPESMLSIPLDYDKCRNAGITIGSGAIFVLDDTRSILENVQNRVRFFLHESCGKCTPCREGLRQAEIFIRRILAGEARMEDVSTLKRYTRAIQQASFCGLGQAAGNSLASSLNYYQNEYLECCVDWNAEEYFEEVVS
ncbi:complex I 51 kDa subunit family protein [Sinanaerobacter chloroacetimidivorans]|uniref:SLBB domain-containing protein n=1 Tax=Sinanaerobacter chloroacetimidivorans TaxID=2818044 RepID=A0A8J7W080_9FIRM|nr:NADH-ubiquinone oxidoreductase-F iron-sulfur binding region domain-containing protein [Sinanaerobacter chloroacetimidivorans]MBR0596838.1 SLBB domain-containing protein [Sinanaerobacter chloroacetimidivorans]